MNINLIFILKVFLKASAAAAEDCVSTAVDVKLCCLNRHTLLIAQAFRIPRGPTDNICGDNKQSARSVSGTFEPWNAISLQAFFQNMTYLGLIG